MNEMVDEVAAPPPAPWWRRLWDRPGFRGVVMMVVEMLLRKVKAP